MVVELVVMEMVVEVVVIVKVVVVVVVVVRAYEMVLVVGSLSGLPPRSQMASRLLAATMEVQMDDPHCFYSPSPSLLSPTHPNHPPFPPHAQPMVSFQQVGERIGKINT